MRRLTLVGISDDGMSLVLSTAGSPPSAQAGGEPAGEFAIALDDRLRAAVRGDRARLGQLEIRFESALRPREIQARVRSGESPQDVAAAAGIPLDRVLRFAAPVLAERDHVTGLARRSPLHRRFEPGGDSLEDAAAARLSEHGVDPSAARWDARRGEDGAWLVTATYRGGSRDRVATFRYDPAARSSTAEDDDGRWVSGEAALPPTARARLAAAGPRRPDSPPRLAPADPFDAMVAAELAAAGAPAGPEGFGRDGAPLAGGGGGGPVVARTAPATGSATGSAVGPRAPERDEETIDVPFAGRWPEMPVSEDPGAPAPGARPTTGPRRMEDLDVPARPPRPRAFARRERTPSRPPNGTEPPEAARPGPRYDSDPEAPAQRRGDGSGGDPGSDRGGDRIDPGVADGGADDRDRDDRSRDDESQDDQSQDDQGPGDQGAQTQPTGGDSGDSGPRPRPTPRNRRQAVPSWDEIMFGRRPD